MNVGNTLFYSLYWRPPSHGLEAFFIHFRVANRSCLQRMVLCLDANARKLIWNSPCVDSRERELEDLLLTLPLSILNRPSNELDFLPIRTPMVDLTLCGDIIDVSDWGFLDYDSLSDHPLNHLSSELMVRGGTRDSSKQSQF